MIGFNKEEIEAPTVSENNEEHDRLVTLASDLATALHEIASTSHDVKVVRMAANVLIKHELLTQELS